MKEDATASQSQPFSRLTLFSDAVVFQIKLGLDAVRDLILSPIAIVCTVIDLVRGPNKEKGSFHALMKIGHKTDVWLNLFGPHSHEQAESQSEEESDSGSLSAASTAETNVDQLILKIETILKEQHSQGGLPASAKLAIDAYLEKLHKADNTRPKR